MRLALAAAPLALAGVIATSGSAHAEPRHFQANGSGVCQAALPNFEGQIRKRPLAIQNEGTATAFVTCSPTSLQFTAGHAWGYAVYFGSQADASVTVNCTGVMGASGWPAEYSTKSVSIGAGGSNGIVWEMADFPGNGADNTATFNVSCQLQPGIGIRTIYVNQEV